MNQEGINEHRLEIERVVDLSTDLLEMFSELRGQTLSYWKANEITTATLHHVAVVERDLAQLGLPSSRLGSAAQEIAKILPFDTEELGTLSRSFDASGDDSSLWREAATPDQIGLLDRWRVWLDQQFDAESDHYADPTNGGTRLEAIFEELTRQGDQ